MRFTVYSVNRETNYPHHIVNAEYLDVTDGAYVFRDRVNGVPLAVFPVRAFFVKRGN